MAQVTLPYTLTAGTPENVNNLVSNLNALVTGVNTIDTAQIATGAVTTTQILDGTVATADIANGAITAAKLASGVGGTALVVGSVSAATERTTTSTTYVDVTSASFSITVASNSVTIITLSVETKNSASNTTTTQALIGSVAPKIVTAAGNTALNGFDTYGLVTGVGGVHSSQSGTGTQTVKAQFLVNNAISTGYVKNLYLAAVNIPL